MTVIYRYQVELHDSLYFATREIGRLYETEPIIHNYALCYALGLIDNKIYATTVADEYTYRYFCPEQIPQYEAHLTPLNEQGIYVTPGRSLFYTASLNTWKYADNRYHVEMEKGSKNIPSFGRNKEIAPESVFEFFVITEKPLPQKLPRWIRLGKWMSKGQLTCVEEYIVKRSKSTDEFIFPYPLNPLDVMFDHQLISYDVINMPPVSLIHHVRMNGYYYQVDGLKIPACMQYRFSSS
jgi:CRISPR-associated protein Csc1